ncbi:hypothetical protein P7K49_004442, partial [Saguinus oedipus]
LLFQGRNPGIAWEYSMPRLGAEKQPPAQPSYTWAIVRSECSVSCGGGRSLPVLFLEVTPMLLLEVAREPSAMGCTAPTLLES